MTTPLRSITDRYDERAACRIRERFGPAGWLVSWSPLPRGRWLARLSCREWPETIERTGRTRQEAIQRADEALRAVLDSLGEADACAAEHGRG